MTLPEFALRYEHCTHHELRQFLQSRTYTSVSKNRNLYFYIKRLRKLDEQTTFRFLDLPPELRNAIYENLVLPRPSTSTVDGRKVLNRDLALLATCQQMKDEGESVLYGAVEIRIQLVLRAVDVRLVVEEPSRHVLQAAVGPEHLEIYRLWPEFVVKIRHASIAVVGHGPEKRGTSIELHRPFETIWSQFCDPVRGASMLKTLSLEVTGHGNGEYGMLTNDHLGKVIRLPRLERLKVNGQSLEPARKPNELVEH